MTTSIKAFNIWIRLRGSLKPQRSRSPTKVNLEAIQRDQFHHPRKHSKSNTTKATRLGQLIFYSQGPQLDATNVTGSEPIRSSIKEYNMPPRIAITNVNQTNHSGCYNEGHSKANYLGMSMDDNANANKARPGSRPRTVMIKAAHIGNQVSLPEPIHPTKPPVYNPRCMPSQPRVQCLQICHQGYHERCQGQS